MDAFGCAADLSDAARLEAVARAAAKSVGATVADSVSYRFQPHGMTLCLVLMESHLVISTWPEHGQAIVNIFLCNEDMDAKACWSVLEKVLQPQKVVFHTVTHRIGSAAKAA